MVRNSIKFFCYCGKDAKERCSRCLIVRYCCKNCQAKDWESHKNFCNMMKKFGASKEIHEFEKILPITNLSDGLIMIGPNLMVTIVKILFEKYDKFIEVGSGTGIFSYILKKFLNIPIITIDPIDDPSKCYCAPRKDVENYIQLYKPPDYKDIVHYMQNPENSPEVLIIIWSDPIEDRNRGTFLKHVANDVESIHLSKSQYVVLLIELSGTAGSEDLLFLIHLIDPTIPVELFGLKIRNNMIKSNEVIGKLAENYTLLKRITINGEGSFCKNDFMYPSIIVLGHKDRKYDVDFSFIPNILPNTWKSTNSSSFSLENILSLIL